MLRFPFRILIVILCLLPCSQGLAWEQQPPGSGNWVTSAGVNAPLTAAGGDTVEIAGDASVEGEKAITLTTEGYTVANTGLVSGSSIRLPVSDLVLEAAGIQFQESGQLENNGEINVLSQASGPAESHGVQGFADLAVSNDGEIIAFSKATGQSMAYGLHVQGAADLTNNGLLTGNAHNTSLEPDGAEGFGAYLEEGGAVENNGLIAGIAVGGVDSWACALELGGSGSVTGDGDFRGIAVSSGAAYSHGISGFGQMQLDLAGNIKATATGGIDSFVMGIHLLGGESSLTLSGNVVAGAYDPSSGANQYSLASGIHSHADITTTTGSSILVQAQSEGGFAEGFGILTTGSDHLNHHGSLTVALDGVYAESTGIGMSTSGLSTISGDVLSYVVADEEAVSSALIQRGEGALNIEGQLIAQSHGQQAEAIGVKAASSVTTGSDSFIQALSFADSGQATAKGLFHHGAGSLVLTGQIAAEAQGQEAMAIALSGDESGALQQDGLLLAVAEGAESAEAAGIIAQKQTTLGPDSQVMTTANAENGSATATGLDISGSGSLIQDGSITTIAQGAEAVATGVTLDTEAPAQFSGNLTTYAVGQEIAKAAAIFQTGSGHVTISGTAVTTALAEYSAMAQGAQSIGGGMTNSGSLFTTAESTVGEAMAFGMAGDDTVLTNNGIISTTAASSLAIVIGMGNMGSLVTNTGSITAEADGDSGSSTYGIFASEGDIKNEGQITALASSESKAIATGIFGPVSNVENSGSIHSQATCTNGEAQAWGLRLEGSQSSNTGTIYTQASSIGDADTSGVYIEQGSFTNDGAIQTVAGGLEKVLAFGIEAIGSQVINNGDVSVSASGSNGLASGVLLTEGSSLVNTGTITASNQLREPPLPTYGVYIFDGATVENSGVITGQTSIFFEGDTDDALINSGTLNGHVSLGGGENSLENSGAIAGDITMSGSNIVDNSGNITGNVYADGDTNDLTNTGTIIGDVSLDGDNDFLDNSGSIDGNVAMGDGNSIMDNTGTVSGDVALGNGVNYMLNSGGIGGHVLMGGVNSLINLGDINGGVTMAGTELNTLFNADGVAGGITLDGSNTVDNSGNITGNIYASGSADDLSNTGTIIGDVSLDGGHDSLDNAGSIDGSVAMGDGTSIMDNSGTVSGDVALGNGVNSMLNYGGIGGHVLMGDGDNDLINIGDIDGGVTMAGTELNTLFNIGGIAGDVTMGDGPVGVVNDGTIGGAVLLGSGDDILSNDGSIGGDIAMADGDDSMYNFGTIHGVNMGAGDDFLALQPDSLVAGDLEGGSGDDFIVLVNQGDLTTQVTGFENMHKDGEGVWSIHDVAMNESTTVAGGTLVVDGSLVSPQVTVNEPAALATKGQITGDLDNYGAITSDSVADSMQISGSLVQHESGLIEIHLDPQGGHTQIAMMGASGTAQILGGTIAAYAPQAYYQSNQFWDVITAEGGVSGTFDVVSIDENSIILEFRVEYLDDRVRIVLYRNSYAQFATPCDSRQIVVGEYLDTIAGNASGDMGDIILLLDYSSDPQTIQSALSQMHPEPYAAFDYAALESARVFGDTLEHRLDLLRDEGRLKDLEKGRVTIFADGLTASNEVDEACDQTGFSHDLKGMQFGIAWHISEEVAVGLAGGIAENDIDWHSLMEDGSMATQYVGAFAAWDAGGPFVEGFLGYQHTDNEAERSIQFADINRHLEADFDGDGIFSRVKAGWKLRLEALRVAPYVSLDYAILKQEAFNETGGDSLNLRVDSRELESLRSRAGVEASYVLELGSETLLVPEFGLGWDHEFLGDPSDISASLSGDGAGSFTVDGARLMEDDYRVSATMNAFFGERVSIYAGYAYRLREEASQFSAGVSLRF